MPCAASRSMPVCSGWCRVSPRALPRVYDPLQGRNLRNCGQIGLNGWKNVILWVMGRVMGPMLDPWNGRMPCIINSKSRRGLASLWISAPCNGASRWKRPCPDLDRASWGARYRDQVKNRERRRCWHASCSQQCSGCCISQKNHPTPFHAMYLISEEEALRMYFPPDSRPSIPEWQKIRDRYKLPALCLGSRTLYWTDELEASMACLDGIGQSLSAASQRDAVS